MPNRIRPIDEKVKSVGMAPSRINVEAAAREAGISPSTLRVTLQGGESSAGRVGAKRRIETKRVVHTVPRSLLPVLPCPDGVAERLRVVNNLCRDSDRRSNR